MDTTNINEMLKAAAQAGDIDLLYTLIQENPYVLENIDCIPFVETPLHVAASFGQLWLATEVMRLKPSFAWKLNRQGFSPIHLAMQHGQRRMVLRLVNINNDLVRVKGREGLTPLHIASQDGDADLLADLLSTCPDSIEDVTMRSETALHVAVKNQHYEALQILIGWLEKTHQRDAYYLERTILNWKDDEGNTILHISALNNDSQALRLLLKTREMGLNARNLENATALDIAASEEIKDILCASKRAKYGSSVTDAPSLADMLRSKITFAGRFFVTFYRLRRETSDEQRNAFLAIAIVLASTSLQTILSPPAGGGVYQANSGDNNNNNNNTNTTSLNSTTTATLRNVIWKLFIGGSRVDLNHLDYSRCFFLLATAILVLMTPGGAMGKITIAAVTFYSSFYINSENEKSLEWVFSGFKACSIAFCILGVCLMYDKLYKRLLNYTAVNLEVKTRNRGGRNIW